MITSRLNSFSNYRVNIGLHAVRGSEFCEAEPAQAIKMH